MNELQIRFRKFWKNFRKNTGKNSVVLKQNRQIKYNQNLGSESENFQKQ